MVDAHPPRRLTPARPVLSDRFGRTQPAYAVVAGVAATLMVVLSAGLALSGGGPLLLLVPACLTVILYALFPSALPALFVIVCVFQNLALAVWIRDETSFAELSMARALSFVVLVALLGMTLAARFSASRPTRPNDRALFYLSLAAMVVVVLGSGVGVLSAGVTEVLAYSRNMSLIPMALIIGLFCSAGKSAVFRCYVVAFVALLLFGYTEMVFREQFYHLLNLDDFILRTSERPSQLQFRYFLGFDQWLNAQQSVLFNDPNLASSGLTGIRLQGPTAHPISFGYAVVIASLPLLARSPIAAVLVQLPLQYGINSKGAFILLLLCAAASFAAPVLSRWDGRSRALILLFAWMAPTVTAIILGLQHADYHVIGFLGGLNAFLANPLGHGVGTAGNLTGAGINGQVDWSTMQQAGATNRGIESAIGVLVDQLGVLFLGYFAVVVAVARRLLRQPQPIAIVLATATMGLVANGVLQEEALFSPSSAGLLFFLIGVFLRDVSERESSNGNLGMRASPVFENGLGRVDKRRASTRSR